MKIWITGICGFLGSHLAEVLIAEGHEVSGNDNLVCGDADNSPIRFQQIDCCNFYRMRDALAEFEPDILVHTAATASEGFSVFSPSFITKNIFDASIATFSAAINVGVKRIINMSSMARYGKGNPPFTEDMLLQPVDPYGIAKVAVENILKVLCETHNVKYATLIPHNIIGTKQQVTPYRNVCSIFLNRLHYNLPIYIYGDGEQKRCFSPVKDCIPSIVKAINGDCDGEIVNIGPDNGEITINKLLDICEEITGKKTERIYLPPRPVTDNVKEAYCSSDKARKLLGYKEEQSLYDCIKEMWANFKPKPFEYNFPIEIMNDNIPKTWKEQL